MGTTARTSPEQSEVIDRFYRALKAIYGTKFSSQFASAREVDQSKAMWGEDIIKHNENQLRECLRNAKKELMGGNRDYQWPNIGLILGYCNNAWERQCHRPIDPGLLLENKTLSEEGCAQRLENLRKLRAEVGL